MMARKPTYAELEQRHRELEKEILKCRQTADKLRRSERELNLIVKTSPDIIYRLDPDGKIAFISDTVKRYGYIPQELIGKDMLDFVHPEDRKIARYGIRERRTAKRRTQKLEVRLFTKDQTCVHFESSRRPVYSENVFLLDAEGVYTSPKPQKNNFLGTLGIARDITERKQAQKQKTRLESQLIQAQKMEAIGILAGGIAHNFNNLLMAIQGRTFIMLMNKDSSHPDFGHLKGIEDSVESAADLTKQLSGLARGGRYEVKPTDLKSLIEKQNQMFGRTKKEISIHTDYEKNSWTVEVDRGQIEQVILNLYVNAWQAMPDGGDIYVQTENVYLDKTYEKPFIVEPGRYVKISITDTGIGMDAATRPRIFEPFFTTKNKDRGTGLGLASVYGIIKNHGGFIDVYSEKGQGATFNIHLPASKKEALEEKKISSDLLKGSETVLLVDDEAMIIDIGQEILEALGYKVLLAGSGKEAIEILSKAHSAESIEKGGKERYARGAIPSVPDLVILDMIMPEMSGGKTYAKLKKINPQIKVLLSSGHSINGQVRQTLNRGCNGFIQKPFKIKALSQKLREILGR